MFTISASALPSIAPPAAVQETAQRLMREMPPTQLHAYSPDQGLPEVRRAVAEYLNGAFSMTYAPEDIYMTSGASAGLAIGCRALLSPGDECITLTPYFSEYRTYTEAAGRRHARGTLRAGDVPARL